MVTFVLPTLADLVRAIFRSISSFNRRTGTPCFAASHTVEHAAACFSATFLDVAAAVACRSTSQAWRQRNAEEKASSSTFATALAFDKPVIHASLRKETWDPGCCSMWSRCISWMIKGRENDLRDDRLGVRVLYLGPFGVSGNPFAHGLHESETDHVRTYLFKLVAMIACVIFSDIVWCHSLSVWRRCIRKCHSSFVSCIWCLSRASSACLQRNAEYMEFTWVVVQRIPSNNLMPSALSTKILA